MARTRWRSTQRQLDSEAGNLAVKLFKGSIGTNNTDSTSRLCMASAVRGTKRASAPDGRRAATPTRPSIAWSSGGATWRSLPGDLQPGQGPPQGEPRVELIVVDPRRTDTAKYATLYVQLPRRRPSR